MALQSRISGLNFYCGTIICIAYVNVDVTWVVQNLDEQCFNRSFISVSSLTKYRCGT